MDEVAADPELTSTSPPAARRQVRAERTYEKILDAAAVAFDRFGFVGASLNDILEEAELTKGALYFHFKSKSEIAHVIVETQFAAFSGLTGDAPQSMQSVIDAMHAMSEALRVSVRVRAGIRLVIEQGSFTEPDAAPYLSWVAIARTLLEGARAAGDVRPEVDLEQVAQFVIGAFTGLQLTSQVLSGREDLHRRVTDMWTFVLPGLVLPDRLGALHPEGTTAT